MEFQRIQLDKAPPAEKIMELAALSGLVQTDLKRVLEESFKASQSDDFYLGLLAGYCVSLELVSGPSHEPAKFVRMAAIATASHLKNRLKTRPVNPEH